MLNDYLISGCTLIGHMGLKVQHFIQTDLWLFNDTYNTANTESSIYSTGDALDHFCELI